MQITQFLTALPTSILRPKKQTSKRLARFAQLLLNDRLQRGQLKISLGQQTQIVSATNDLKPADIRLNKPLRFFYKLYSQGHMGFAKAYVDGDVDTHDLWALLTLGVVNRDVYERMDTEPNMLRSLARFWGSWQHKKRHNSRKNARKNIAAHYDLGNDFYRLWLDDSMTYSAAYYQHTQQPLQEAQHAKNTRIIDALDLQAGQRVLEIGCGWGGFARAAAQRGVAVKGLTLSEEQHRYANDSFTALPESAAHAQAHLQDYRDEQDSYDAIVSIEMFEAVGTQYWQTYFETLQRCLKPQGKALLQVITFEGSEQEVAEYQSGSDFIQTYIFPGGVLPSKAQLQDLATANEFEVEEQFCFGQDYGKTLAAWREKFLASTEALEALGYDETFRRLWDYYLVYCQVGFEQSRLDVVHVLLNKTS